MTSGFPQSALGVGIAHPAFPHEINKVFEIVEEGPSAITQLLWSLGMILGPALASVLGFTAYGEALREGSMGEGWPSGQEELADELLEAVVQAAKRGVICRVLLDDVGRLVKVLLFTTVLYSSGPVTPWMQKRPPLRSE